MTGRFSRLTAEHLKKVLDEVWRNAAEVGDGLIADQFGVDTLDIGGIEQMLTLARCLLIGMKRCARWDFLPI
jgi:hypothetical protein